MLTVSDFYRITEQQLLYNQNKSLFYTLTNGRTGLNASEETTRLFKRNLKEVAQFIRATKSEGTYQQLLEDIADKVIRLFIQANQYLDFNHEDHRKLQKIYGDLFEQIYVIGNQKEQMSDKEVECLFHLHYQNLKIFLLESNGTEIFKKYKESPYLFTIKCAEYTPEFQMKLLNIHLDTIKQPVLDIGCGSQANLVRFLRKNGIEAFGIDRNVHTMNYLYKANWLEYTFTPNTWGTVISHMAFSNQFMHHHLRVHGKFELYAKKYMEILESLKIEGSFIYAPGLPFMEELLVSLNKAYVVATQEIDTQNLSNNKTSFSNVNRKHVTKVIRVT
ncbi:class I SAM-dependent methyltransferase [Aneurinibacillus thermoaerophilus]|uniref:class I SAM-dependent methyltransferase n=1 Tax=Aneurinibacillus thermoaerophilus TaxID=143495 RepID=UPI002E1D6205|nr:class I SAM-dependent methyltransferase [Aneurinibacillus thermoaerophilus]MED0764880.1 class I SAM-dependent methyltransferase [Aneurinibacillus thermoaerophilus]